MKEEITKQDIYKELKIIEEYFNSKQKNQQLFDKLIIYITIIFKHIKLRK